MKITLDIKDSNYYTFLEFIKTLNYVSIPEIDIIPQWQQDEVKKRLKTLKEQPENAIDFDLAIDRIEKKYDL